MWMPQRKLLQSYRFIVKKILIVFLTLLIITILVGTVFASLLIKVKKIECNSQYSVCSKEINEQISKYEGKSLFLVKRKIKHFLSSEKSVTGYTFQYQFPNTLKIDLLIQKPSFCIKTPDKYLLISDSGQILSESNECNLPKVNSETVNKNIGDNIDDLNLFALKIMQGVYEMYQVSEGKVHENTLTVELNRSLTVLFPVSVSDPAVIIGALRLIITKIESEGSNFHEIDLRFKNPVLR